MKVIFLDYDGVLNNPYFLIRQTKRGAENDFDPKKIKILKQICSETGALVVVTSSWRFNKRARLFLLKQGIPICDILGIDTGTRGEDIDRYLQETPLEINDYLILDDETSHYSPTQMKHVICTRECFHDGLCAEFDCLMGLQEKHIKWAKAMLEE